MKIKISFAPEESQNAGTVLKLLQQLFPDAKLRSSITHPPRKTVYLVIDGDGKRRKH